MHFSVSEVIYVGIFGLSAAACYVSVLRARDIPHDDTQRGLVALLLFSGTWATASVGRLIAHTPAFQVTFYTIGLVVGLATVWAWLYFCSAYAGYDYHQQTTIRQVALTGFLLITSVKLTNPLHQMYFGVTNPTGPSQRVVIELSVLHWAVTGLAYALTAVGFYLLFELFRESRFQTRALGALVALTAVPAVIDIVAFSAFAPEFLLQFNYEPVGVALFAVGVLFIVDEEFVAIPRFWRKDLIKYLELPVVVLDTSNRIRDFNAAAIETFPGLADHVGAPLEEVSTELPVADETSDDVVAYEHDEATRFFTIQRKELSIGPTVRGTLLVYKDITDIEGNRRELQRQNEQLDEFAVALNHELRNAITIIQGFLDTSAETITGNRSDDDTAIQRAASAIDRMERVISDLSTLARFGQTPETVGECDLEAVAEAAWNQHNFTDMTYTAPTGVVIEADQPRLEAILSDMFRFASTSGASEVSVTVEDEAVVFTADGSPLSESVQERAFEYGPPVAAQGAEMALPNVRLIARVHGWTATIDDTYTDGVRVRLTGVTVISSSA